MSILNEYTKEKHREAEASSFVQYMIQGAMTREHYIVFLQQIWHIYDAIERFAKLTNLLNGLPDIERAGYIAEDLQEMEAECNVPMLPSIAKYCSHIEELYNNGPQNDILAHVYVRHMGDMYGGKFIAQRVPGPTRSYQFTDRSAVIKALNEKLSISLVPEALLAFDMSLDIFNELAQVMALPNTNVVSDPADAT